MPSVALIGTGVLLVAFGGYGFLNPQRQYEIRQWGQTTDNPRLSDTGKLLWRFFDGLLVLFGLATFWLAFNL
jgi:hypothetical protein